ncbi:GGDEF domain-containing protein [Exiguobacterium sp. SH3S2]|uniref:GGDEF domain-containing protein n=1 Tax=unclassified Exiguobacterium TaxID=2644629 RepID=UPI00103D626F|nr:MULTISPECIES: GGDEF domain-containing protein [unclassified Exiguobacterium]TCI45662.1 GGDEF domain-containing protein [Exiguobacterium sp. SH3S3]TCI58710.1 GGDEF domain-containing protein [Exiguobacterium sp. SH3S1]TCI60871.1 GGDEF domain-containing protein [Exiguobacterium sp. SH3S2]
MEQHQLTDQVHRILAKITEARQIQKTEIEFLLDWMKTEVKNRRLMHLLEIFSRVESDVRELPPVLTQSEAIALIAPVKRYIHTVLGIEQEDEDLVLILSGSFSTFSRYKPRVEKLGARPVFLQTIAEAVEYDYEDVPKAIVMDVELWSHFPERDIQSFVSKMKKLYVPLIVIGTNEHYRLAAYSYGFDDYWESWIPMEERLVRLGLHIEKARLVSNALLVDELTGAFNRKYLKATFSRFVSRLERSGESFTLALLDIDHFKQLNDTFGHAYGDEVLHRIAEEIRLAIRSSDELIRYGGEEFLVILNVSDRTVVDAVLERVRTRIEQMEFPYEHHVTVSIGYTRVCETGMTLGEWCAYADEALYKAKRDGRNRIIRYSSAVREEKRLAYVTMSPQKYASLAEQLPKQHRRYEVVYRPYDLYACNDNVEMFILDESGSTSTKGTLSAVKEQRGKYSHILAVTKRTATELGTLYDDLAEQDRNDVITEKIEQWLEKLPD